MTDAAIYSRQLVRLVNAAVGNQDGWDVLTEVRFKQDLRSVYDATLRLVESPPAYGESPPENFLVLEAKKSPLVHKGTAGEQVRAAHEILRHDVTEEITWDPDGLLDLDTRSREKVEEWWRDLNAQAHAERERPE